MIITVEMRACALEQGLKFSKGEDREITERCINAALDMVGALIRQVPLQPSFSIKPGDILPDGSKVLAVVVARDISQLQHADLSDEEIRMLSGLHFAGTPTISASEHNMALDLCQRGFADCYKAADGFNRWTITQKGRSAIGVGLSK